MSRDMRVISIALIPMPAPSTIQSQQRAMTTTSAATTTVRSRRNIASSSDGAASVIAANAIRASAVTYLPSPFREQSIRPLDRRVVAILAGVVPTHAVVGEGAALAAYSKRQFVRRYWMAGCPPDLAGWVQASQWLHGHLHNPRYLYRVVFPVHDV